MSKTPQLLIIFSLLWLSFQRCENNGIQAGNSEMCTCPPNFIGKNCSIPAYELKLSDTSLPMGANFTFAYLQPEQKMIYRFILTFCAMNHTQSLEMVLFAQEEQLDGDINLVPTNPREMLGFSVGGQTQCKQIFSTFLVSIGKKINGEVPKIVFGMKLDGNSTLLEGEHIMANCQISSIFGTNFLVTVAISFVAIVGFFMVVMAVIMLRRKYLQHRQVREKQQRKKECMEKMMPTQKYQNLVEEGDGCLEDHTCSICLCEFQSVESVRKTPCGHVYHEACLDSWCNSHLTCPICRKSFEKTQEMETLDERLNTDNIRQNML